MRLLAAFLALAVLSGCQARSFPLEELQSSWESTLSRFQDYVSDLNSRADGVLQDIKESQISRELDTLIQDSLAELSSYRDDVQTKLAPLSLEAAERLQGDLQLLAGRLRGHVAEAGQQVASYGQELQALVDDSVRLPLETYSRKLAKRLQKDVQEISRRVEDYYGEVQSRATDNVEDLKARLDPYLAQVRDNAQAKVSTLSELLRSQLEVASTHVQTAAQDLRGHLEDAAQDLSSTAGGKLEELRDWLEPYVALIRGKL
ncbi:apolipoprotein Ea [Menidia menidia]